MATTLRPSSLCTSRTRSSTGMGSPTPPTGRESVRQIITMLLGLVPDLHFEAKRAYFGADHIVFEYDMSGTTDGSRFVCDGVDVILVADGLVARKDTYLDLAAYERQAGCSSPNCHGRLTSHKPTGAHV